MVCPAMCTAMMDGSSSGHASGTRRARTPATTWTWRRRGVASEGGEALGDGRADAGSPYGRKRPRRDRKRARAAEPNESAAGALTAGQETPPAAPAEARHPGAMAPRNTTQYLMSNVYGDMAEPGQDSHFPGESPPPLPDAVYAAPDCGYDRCLAFQLRDFEALFGRYW